MATSGLYTFNLDIADIIEDAYERCRMELKSGYQLKTAIRSLDLMLTEWTNRGVNLWAVDQSTTAITSGTETYTLDTKWVDILDAVLRNSSSIDTTINRISMAEYLQLPNKATTGQPTQYTVERNSSGGHTVYLYPTPDASFTLVYWGIRYNQDAGAYDDNADVPKRFVPALTSGLAYYLADKNPAKTIFGADGRPQQVEGIGSQRRLEMKARYEEEFEAARFEDHERSSLFVLPDVSIVKA